jgi:hypothetical protein
MWLGFTVSTAGPAQVTLKPIVEVRQRMERRIDRDFADASNDNRTDLFGRYRVGLGFGLREWSGKLVYQVADDEAWTASRNWMTERRDVVLAYAERKVGPGVLTLGRQRLKIGTERLLSEANWSNLTFSFDAVRFRTKEWDVFAGKPAVAPRMRSEARLAGGVLRSEAGETLLVFTHDAPNTAPSDRWTLDHVVRTSSGRLGVELEAAGQAGRDPGGRVDAWAVAGKLSYALTPRLSVTSEANLATSDFDVLYGAMHARCGIMDLQGWRNAQNLGLGLKFRASKTVDLGLDWHALALRDARDPWFGNTGSPYRRPGGVYVDPTGASGRDLGQEFDVEARWQAGHGITVGGGIGIFQPGRFVRQLGGEGRQTFGYLEMTYRF